MNEVGSFFHLPAVRDGHTHVRCELQLPITVAPWARNFVVIAMFEFPIDEFVLEQTQFIIVVRPFVIMSVH